MDIIETKRLILRNYIYGDEKEIMDLLIKNHEHLKYVMDDWELQISSLNDFRKYIKRYEVAQAFKKIYVFGIWDNYSQKLVGQIILFHIDWGNKIGEIGCFIDSKCQQQGFATEANHELLKYAFQTLNLSKIIMICHKNNYAIHRVGEKCGFTLIDQEGSVFKLAINRERFLNN